MKYGLLAGRGARSRRVEAWPTLPGPGRRARRAHPRAASTTSSPSSPRTSATAASAPPSTSATRSATASRRRRATTATATARPSRSACSPRCGCPSATVGLDAAWRERTAARAGAPRPARRGSTRAVATPAILAAMGRDKKADADGAQHGAGRGARRRAPARQSPAARPARRGHRGAAPMSGRMRIALLHGPEPRHARPASVGPLRHAHPARARGPGPRLGGGARACASASSRPTTRARSSSTSTASPGSSTARSSTRAPGPTTSGRSATRSRCWARPFVEVHLSDVEAREPHRRVSVVRDIASAAVWGKGPDGYRDALDHPRGGARDERPRRPPGAAARGRSTARDLGALLVTDRPTCATSPATSARTASP